MKVLGANDLMTIANASNDESLNRALVKYLRLFAKHGRKIRHERFSPKEDYLDREKETNDSDKRELVGVHGTTEISIDGKV
jgi:hypothetical protein